MNKIHVASLQTNARSSVNDNIKQISELFAIAGERGVQLVALPEACDFLHEDPAAMRAYAQPLESHVALREIAKLAAHYRSWVLLGSLTVRNESGGMANRSLVLTPDGEASQYYDKIHMFDANIPGSGDFRESDIYSAGTVAAMAKLPWCNVGLSICYDLRFPHLYRRLAQAGAHVLAIPAAFTYHTGSAHWHTLVRARAIENTCFVIATAQTGCHYGQRLSFGHSMIVDPWGEVLAEGSEDVECVSAVIDLDRLTAVRGIIGSLSHDRDFALPAMAAGP